MGLLAFLRIGVWMNGLRAFKNGFMGNVLGEGFILGGVFVIGRGQQVQPLHSVRTYRVYVNDNLPPLFVFRVQGILLEHRELEFGDKVNADDVLRAARRIPQEPLQRKN